jgi:hypothetical protein
MLVAKPFADLITSMRAVLAFWLAWLGIVEGEAALPLAVWILIASWTSDSLDGPVARRSRRRYRSWVGDHDLEIDMLVSVGLLVFLLGAGYLHLPVVIIYLSAWALVFWHWGLLRSPGMLFQAPIYGWFIWVAVHRAPNPGWWLLIWISLALALTWPRFLEEIVPGFLSGFQEAWKGGHPFGR